MFQMLLRILAFSECVRNINSSPLPNVNTDSSPLLPKSWIEEAKELMQSNPETVEEMASSSETVVEGDELMDEDRNAVDNLWTHKRISVPYVISPELTRRTNVIKAAMDMISEKTCVSFHPRMAELDYLHFKRSYGCASYIGHIGGPQTLYVGPYCHKGNICHEILHALGLHHEQTRPDHHHYITILYENIIAGKTRNFKAIHANMLGSRYDTCSIMHYGPRYFSSNGKPTIIDKTGKSQMGQRGSLSELDIVKVRKLYKCDA